MTLALLASHPLGYLPPLGTGSCLLPRGAKGKTRYRSSLGAVGTAVYSRKAGSPEFGGAGISLM
jgi:hypothetical protein